VNPKPEYTDIHIHLLPGLDDGPADWEESLALLKSAWAAGTRRFCATPHFEPSYGTWSEENALALVEELSHRAASEGFPAEIRLGAEVALFPEIVEASSSGSLPSLGGSRYVLLESPAGVLPPNFPEFIFRFRASGGVPVLAHPERTDEFIRKPARMRAVVAAGALVQITAESLTGGAGKRVRRTARAFLEEGWVHAVASDGHGPTVHRLIDLGEAERELRKVIGDEGMARHLVTDGPLRLMGGAGA